MGETASKLRLVFEAMVSTRGVYFFDEFDAIGACRSERNDVGEIRRVLNSFLQLLENDDSEGLIIAATNHRELLDPALFRRFDDVISYSVPYEVTAVRIIEMRLSSFNIQKLTGMKSSRLAWG
jgi:SpoVK/Ycf46/Vps4 family AAA+-type ATPase